MSRISVDVSSARIPVLQVGYQGENEVTDVLFDISSWITEFGEGVAQLRVKRPGNSEEESYVLSLTITDGIAVWTVSETDTFNKGNGKVQLSYLVGNILKKAVIYPYKVGKSIVGADNPVDPFDSWIERSKAWAIGETLDGDYVPETDETYQNNAKYYAEQADILGSAQVVLAREQVTLATEKATLATEKATLATEKADAAAKSEANAASSEAAFNGVSTQLTTRMSAIETEQSVQSARIDTFTSLPEGSTSGNAELADIRVGAAGTTYDTAGNAVRGQISELKSDLGQLSLDISAEDQYMLLNYEKNEYIKNGDATISFEKVSHSEYESCVVDVSGLEYVTITGTASSNSQARLYALTDDVGVIYARPANAHVSNDEIIFIPPNATKMIINHWKTGGPLYLYKGIKKTLSIKRLNNALFTKVLEDNYVIGGFNTAGDMFESTNVIRTKNIVPISEFASFYLSPDVVLNILFYYNGTYTGRNIFNINYAENFVNIIPAGVKTNGVLVSIKYADDREITDINDLKSKAGVVWWKSNVDYFTPEMFGAVGDGVTDDTAALQDSIDAAAYFVKTLKLPRKDYKITGTLTADQNFICIDGDNTNIHAYGNEAALVVGNATNLRYQGSVKGINLISHNENSGLILSIDHVSEWAFEDIHVLSASANNLTVGIKIRNTTITKFDNIYLSTLHTGVLMEHVASIWMSNFNVWEIKQAAFAMQDSCSTVKFVNMWIEHALYGFYAPRDIDTSITACGINGVTFVCPNDDKYAGNRLLYIKDSANTTIKGHFDFISSFVTVDNTQSTVENRPTCAIELNTKNDTGSSVTIACYGLNVSVAYSDTYYHPYAIVKSDSRKNACLFYGGSGGYARIQGGELKDWDGRYNSLSFQKFGGGLIGPLIASDQPMNIPVNPRIYDGYFLGQVWVDENGVLASASPNNTPIHYAMQSGEKFDDCSAKTLDELVAYVNRLKYVLELSNVIATK